jgi:hypothetical protein
VCRGQAPDLRADVVLGLQRLPARQGPVLAGPGDGQDGAQSRLLLAQGILVGNGLDKYVGKIQHFALDSDLGEHLVGQKDLLFLYRSGHNVDM